MVVSGRKGKKRQVWTVTNGFESTPYCGPFTTAEALLSTWNLDPWLIAMITLSFGALLLHRSKAGFSSGKDSALAIAFVGVIVAFVSPLCAATVALFSARAVHHLVLVSVVAPALAVALPWRALSAPLALAATTAALILWHVPAVYDAAWSSVGIYWGMQVVTLLPAWLFWSSILHPRQSGEDLLAHALGVGGLAASMGFIGAVLTFAPTGLYPQHLIGSEAFGLTLLADQQLAGLIMWVPGFLPLAGLALWMVRRGWKQGFAA